jgi:Glycosyl transferases group 1.
MKKNRLLAIPGAFVPANDTVTLISYKHLRQAPYDIDVLALSAPIDDTLQKELSKDECFDKFNIEYTYEYSRTVASFEKKNVLEGLFNLFRYVHSAIKKARENDYEVIYTSSIPSFTHLAGYRIKKKLGNKVKWIASFSDPLYKSPYKYDPDSYKEYSLLAKIGFHVYIAIYMNGFYEKIAMKYADEILYISEEQRDFMIGNQPLKRQPLLLEKSTVVPLNYIPEWQMYRSMIEEQKNTEKKPPYTIVHLGRVYGHRRIEKLLQSLKELKEDYPNLSEHILFEQYGELLPRYVKLIQEYNIGDVFRYFEKIPYGEANQKMVDCDVLALFDTILTVENQPYLPSKILEYILMRKEIFAISEKNSPANRLLTQLGYTCCDYDVADIKRTLSTLIKEGPNKYYYDLDAFKNKRYID